MLFYRIIRRFCSQFFYFFCIVMTYCGCFLCVLQVGKEHAGLKKMTDQLDKIQFEGAKTDLPHGLDIATLLPCTTVIVFDILFFLIHIITCGLHLTRPYCNKDNEIF